MSITDPLSLTEAKRLAGSADTVLLRATRDADLETPIGAFLRLDDGGPAYLLESVEGGERLGRYSFLGIGPRRLLEVRGDRATIQDRPAQRRPVRRRPADRDARVDRPAEHAAPVPAAPAGPAGRGDAPLHRRRGRRPGLRRGQRLRAERAPARRRPGRRADGGVHRIGPGDRLRPPDPHDQRDRLAAHRGRPTSTAATGSPSGRSSRRSTGRRGRRPAEIAGAAAAPGRMSAGGEPGGRRASFEATATSLGRDQYIHAVEVAKDAIAAGEAIQVVLARRQSFELPRAADGRHGRRHRPVPRPPPGQSQPVPVLRPDAGLRGRRRQPGAAPPGRGRPPDHPPDRRHPAARRHAGRGRPAQRGAPARPQGEGRARDARRPRPQRPRPGRPGGHRPGHQVHGGRALQPRPAPGQPRRGPAASRSSTRSTRCARSSRPGRCRARPRSGRCS